MAASFKAKWGIWVGSELRAYEVATEEDQRSPVLVADIPPYGKTQAPRITFDQLKPADGLREVFKRCHNYIYANDGIPKDKAFNELLKLFFCKIYDEQNTTGQMRFDVSTEERRSVLGQRRLRQRIDEMFKEVKEQYLYIFAPHDRIELSDPVLAYIVSELRRYSLLLTTADVKGEAYQEIVRENLRGSRGEFFTPPNVCQMAVRMVMATYPTDKWLSLKAMDPACGTGGFLRAQMNLWRDHIRSIEEQKWKDTIQASDKAAARLKDICDRLLFGVDINPELVRAAQMNLVMHGDGSTNVYQANSLFPPGEWRDDVKAKVKPNSYDLVYTNPPFGAGPGLVVTDPHVLDQFELPKFETTGPRGSMPPEQLFIERCWQLLKPGGRMAIVLPDSILSNPGLEFVRHWILKRCRIIASIDLPVETFLAFSGTGTQTSVLLLEKKSADEMRLEEASKALQDYEVFMALCRTSGFDRRGNDLWVRTPEGEEVERLTAVTVPIIDPSGVASSIEKHELRRVRNDEVAHVAPLFEQWLAQGKLRRQPV